MHILALWHHQFHYRFEIKILCLSHSHIFILDCSSYTDMNSCDINTFCPGLTSHFWLTMFEWGVCDALLYQTWTLQVNGVCCDRVTIWSASVQWAHWNSFHVWLPIAHPTSGPASLRIPASRRKLANAVECRIQGRLRSRPATIRARRPWVVSISGLAWIRIGDIKSCNI